MDELKWIFESFDLEFHLTYERKVCIDGEVCNVAFQKKNLIEKLPPYFFINKEDDKTREGMKIND